MNAAVALRAPDAAFCTACSSCEALLPVAAPASETSLLELRCPYCGTQDVYHVKTLRPYLEKAPPHR